MSIPDGLTVVQLLARVLAESIEEHVVSVISLQHSPE
jgi:hypothetical protein